MERIGKLVVPHGAPEAGMTFSDAFFHVLVRVPEVVVQELEILQYIYSFFQKCPQLRSTRNPGFEALEKSRKREILEWVAATATRLGPVQLRSRIVRK